MGFTTMMLIHNDVVSMARDDVKIGAAIHEATVSYPHTRYHEDARVRVRTKGGAAVFGQIVSQAHADYPQICVAYHNSGYRIDDPALPEVCIQAVIDSLKDRGYRVFKARDASKRDAACSAE